MQKEEWISMATLNFLNLIQTVIVNGGFLVGSLYCGYLVYDEEKTVGDYVLFGSYILQLMVPLNWLGTLYRLISNAESKCRPAAQRSFPYGEGSLVQFKQIYP